MRELAIGDSGKDNVSMVFLGLQKQGKLKKEIRELEAEKTLLLRLLEGMQKEIDFSQYLVKNNIRKIAIYGCNNYSNFVFEYLKNKDCKLEYIITENLNVCPKDIKLLTMEEKLPKVDGIMICELFQEDVVREKLLKKGFVKIFTFSDIIYMKLEELQE